MVSLCCLPLMRVMMVMLVVMVMMVMMMVMVVVVSFAWGGERVCGNRACEWCVVAIVRGCGGIGCVSGVVVIIRRR